LLAYSYQLQAQLTTVKTLLLQRRGRLDHNKVDAPLKQAAQSIGTVLTQPQLTTLMAPRFVDANPTVDLPDPFAGDLSPWLLRRLELACGIAEHLRCNADQVVTAVSRQA
jgi:hypothetical protein